MWVVFVVTAAIVVFVVAAVAAGRGEGLATVPPDRLPDPLPEGPLTADDVAAARFAVGLRGYRMDQVDAALGRLRAELIRRDERIGRLEAVVQGVPVRAGPPSTGPDVGDHSAEARSGAIAADHPAQHQHPPSGAPGGGDPGAPGGGDPGAPDGGDPGAPV